MLTRKSQASPMQPWVPPQERPEDYGHHKHRCESCGAWLCRWHDPDADGGLCWPCSPGGDGIVIQVAFGVWERVDIEEMLSDLRAESVEELMVA